MSTESFRFDFINILNIFIELGNNYFNPFNLLSNLLILSIEVGSEDNSIYIVYTSVFVRGCMRRCL